MVRVTRWQHCRAACRRARVDFLVERKVVDLNLGAGLGKNGHVLDEILELAHIATPRTRSEEIQRVLAESRDFILGGAMPAPEDMQEMIREQGNVLEALTQWRNGYLHDVETVIQILSQLLAPDCFARIAIGGGNEANIDDRVFFLTADAANDAVLEDA